MTLRDFIINCRTSPAVRRAVCTIAAIVLLLPALPAGLAQEPFDHFSTGFVLDGAHATVTCDGCHVGAIFAATDSRCVSCHSSGGPVRASQTPRNHVPTTAACEDCHTTASWGPVAYMDHTAVMGSCGSCHNGIQAGGKSPNHIASGANCDDCHQSVTWIPAVFDHAGINSGCFQCHNGIDNTGKNPMHINTTNLCEDCHNNIVWAPATMVDHAQVIGTCVGCHNGVIADGKHAAHITSGNNCDDCHTTVAWLPATFDHATITGNCSSCHNGTDATGKDAGHFITMAECNVCHDTTAWTPHTYMHTGLAYEPLDHSRNLSCTDCHQANSDPVQWSSPAYQPDCAGCHANDYKPGVDKHNGIDADRNCASAGCHRITGREW